MSYKVLFSSKAKKYLSKIDKYQAKLILNWIESNLVGTENPRLHGKPLAVNRIGEWRYRVGNYRVLAEITDDTVEIYIFKIGHRRDVYEN